MHTITLEEHFTTPAVLEATRLERNQNAAMAAFMRKITERMLDVGEGRIAAMDKDGIDRQVISLAGGGLNFLEPDAAHELAQEANRIAVAAVARAPGRLSAFAALAMQKPDAAAQELEHCVRDLGFKGALVDGTAGGEFLDHERFMPVFEAAQALDVPIYLHPAPPPAPVEQAYFADLRPPLNMLLAMAGWGWHVETGLHVLRLIASGLFDRLPKLKLIVGHMGENLPFSIDRADCVISRAGLPLKRSIKEYFVENVWITSSGYFTAPPFLCARESLGVDRILLSIDYPFSDLSNGHRFLKTIGSYLSEEQVEKVAFRNAAELLKIEM